MNRHFFSELPPFRDFARFTADEHYCAVPDDWLVYVTDVVNSTEAIASGLYKQVNLIGAASITLCLDLLRDISFPFVFGGDGATLCVPAAARAEVDAELGRLMRLAKDNFALELRVACIPVATLLAAGARLEVARFELVAGSSLAFFRGGGTALADRLAKSEYARFAVPMADVAVEELAGLSCRWSPLPNRSGCVLSVLVVPDASTPRLPELLEALQSVLGKDLEAANPAVLNQVRYKGLWRILCEEWRFHRSVFSTSFLKRCIEIVLAVVIFRHGINVAKNSFDSRHYVQHVGFHSDYRKYDDMLRLVLDCSLEQADALEKVLEGARAEGRIHYGLHRADEALMTCFVRTMQDGGHLHFIDGGSGGLAMAAQQLKAQLAAA